VVGTSVRRGAPIERERERATRVLIAEDDESLRALMRLSIDVGEIEIDEATDGNEALALARANPPDVVLLDWMMPGPDGLEVCRALRADPLTAGAYIVIVTARALTADREQALAAGADMIFDIDWQGTRQVVKALPDDVVTVFILPPSMAELQTRLERRAEDPPETIAKRLESARSEIERWEEYDYVLVNDDLDRAFNDLTAILRAERLKRQRRVGLSDFVGQLLGKPDA
jgi:CheY-like chemotaxis protein